MYTLISETSSKKLSYLIMLMHSNRQNGLVFVWSLPEISLIR